MQSSEAAHLAFIQTPFVFENVSLAMHARAKDPTNVG
jgi:hypothetical protein